jgi:hypothetical protein
MLDLKDPNNRDKFPCFLEEMECLKIDISTGYVNQSGYVLKTISR